MDAQQVLGLSSTSAWMLVLTFLSVCSGMAAQNLHLESTVFVAGKELDIILELPLPTNQSDVLTCSDPSNQQIYRCDIYETHGAACAILHLKNLTISGEYSCQYKKSKVYWFLRVVSEEYWYTPMFNYEECYVVSFFIGVLLIFSVVGSVRLFRGHWKYCNTGCGNRKQTQSREERKEGEVEEDNVDAITAPSTSFYASLETRPRSIYDVLDHSAANGKPDQSQEKPKEKIPKETMAQTTQDEGVFECVYENF